MSAADLVWRGYDALIFDWDGTLAHSQPLNFSAMQQALRRQGAHIDAKWFEDHSGLSAADMVEVLAADKGIVLDASAAASDRDQAYLSRLGEVAEITAVADVLRSSHGVVSTAVASGGGGAVVLPTLRALGLNAYVDAVITREDVRRGKPAPDLFLAAAKKLGTPENRCLVFEDSDEGVSAARAAGMDSIDVRGLRPATQ